MADQKARVAQVRQRESIASEGCEAAWAGAKAAMHIARGTEWGCGGFREQGPCAGVKC